MQKGKEEITRKEGKRRTEKISEGKRGQEGRGEYKEGE
jgi:hypothetical protein